MVMVVSGKGVEVGGRQVDLDARTKKAKATLERLMTVPAGRIKMVCS